MLITSVCLAQDDNNNKRDVVTKETVTQFSNDEELLDIWRKQHEKEPKKKTPKVKEPKTPKVKKIVTPETLYKRGKRFKVAGYAIGGSLVTAGVISMVVGACLDKYDYERLYADNNNIYHYKSYNGDRDVCFPLGGLFMGGGVVIGVPLVVIGSSLQKKSANHINSVSAINQDINFSNGTSLNLGIDVLSNNLSFTKTPGIGIRYNF